MSWAQLLKRVFAIDMASYPQCGDPLTIITAIEDPMVIAKILAHLGCPPEPHPGPLRNSAPPFRRPDALPRADSIRFSS
jgi:hypothetical protein